MCAGFRGSMAIELLRVPGIPFWIGRSDHDWPSSEVLYIPIPSTPAYATAELLGSIAIARICPPDNPLLVCRQNPPPSVLRYIVPPALAYNLDPSDGSAANASIEPPNG